MTGPDRATDPYSPDAVREAVAYSAEARSEEEEPAEERIPTISEQMAEQLGGVRGLIESSIPVCAFVVLNLLWDLYPAIFGAVGTAVAIAIYRLIRKQPVRHAVNGLVGIALGAYLAARSGEARDFYLPGILLTFAQAAVLIISVGIRKPLIGFAWAIIAAGGKHDWRRHPALFRTFQWLTLAWAASLIMRAGVQAALWVAEQPDLLGIARIVISWPTYIGMLALTVWAVRRTLKHSPMPAPLPDPDRA
ncbi:DUF3159 domain-containing protein [Catenuloplanes indicus]|uniref:DUF3159 domain-containing protein n=1 Tax=Catenuloplanes indicus TaxID=137267 RepID=A0AAE3W6F5_9ACTN|nr:DUF3159 domain-containing protein [Catenuloplanes indicus]MDQ0369265.1 hypothetical protein [Catenuloplanes indicus]